MSDHVRETSSREMNTILASKGGRYLQRLDDALNRLMGSPDSFGLCQSCHAEIPFERLYTLPHVRFCLTCKISLEADEEE